ncbi:MlaE family ABC transporter permease [Chitinimonas sp.]|uniref:MlaE family ABC transporter permease n=1 Tax=Chitinimonas sp. TaxID=1934313 RepID=UPI0035AEB6A0
MLKPLRFWRSVLLSVGALRHWPVRRALARQVYFSGIQALPVVLFVGTAVGGIVASQLHYQIGQSGEGALRLLASITLTELAPLLTAILLTARSSSAMASELALMRMHGEIRALTALGVDIGGFLVLPRVLGMLLSATALTFYFALVAIVAGALGVAGFGWRHELLRLSLVLSPATVALCLAKSLAFGALLAGVACARGLASNGTPTDVPVAASSAVMRALASLFALDLLFILLGRYA